jgi:hypothetical protein
MEKCVEAELLKSGMVIVLIRKMVLHSSSLLTTRPSSMSNLVRNNMQFNVIHHMDQSLEVILLFKITATIPQITTHCLDLVTPYQQECHGAQMNQSLTLQEVTNSK